MWNYINFLKRNSSTCNKIFNMKKLITIILLMAANSISAQESKIVEILNKELYKEVKMQFKHPDFQGDTLTIIKPFSIDENKVLSLEFIKPLPENEGYNIEKQEVALEKIKSFGKDINVFLEAETDAVRITQTKIYKNKKEVAVAHTFHLFITPIHHQKPTINLSYKMKKAFKKTDNKNEVNYWFN